LIGQVIGAKGNEPTIGTGDVDVAIPQSFQVEVPGVLKSHAGNAKGVRLRAGQEHIPLAETRPTNSVKLNHVAGRWRRPISGDKLT
jgi:hypothetical protein